MRREQRMMDRASREQRAMRHYMDGRNPYGSRGGYVRDSRMSRRSDYAMDRNYGGRDYAEHDMRQDYTNYPQSSNERDSRANERTREYMGSYGNVPFYMSGREHFDGNDYGRDYNDYGDYNDYADYGEQGYKLEKEEIEEWIGKLMQNLEQDEKETFKMEKVSKKAQENGERFDKYSKEELFVTTLMIYTDFKNRIGKNNVEFAVGMAKDFLCDKDAKVKYGEKLAKYYDEIVMGGK